MKLKKGLTRTFLYVVEAFVIIISAFPILWVIMSAFKTNGEILSDPLALPSSISFDTFAHLFETYNFPVYFLNSLLAAGVSTVVSLLFYSMGAYVIAKFQFPGRRLLYVLFTITLLVPSHSKTQPIFSLIMYMGLYDNIWGVTFVYLSMGMAMSIFILKAGFMAVPKTLDEAAIVDGAGFVRVFWRINLPLAKNALTTAGILMFLNNWNEYYFASLLTVSDSQRTLPIALAFFTSEFSYNYTQLFSALAVVILPGIILYALAQEKVQASVATAGIKG
ncbi:MULTISPECIES: carbohydrate ABC transporter permease [Oscillospiraceae]|uniref:carbohydrate ABC transporter permease n=1 Tax=Oscillospiraceae TaxID=216572 RepID=UPI000B38430A|nr:MULTISPECIES: carbohydrate ABC transporter permease [Oscillospiraceae]MBM6723814.1 carbohydrate ABC transporter permease [Pseudoflavonifractor phocaeensis]MBM6887461.1 carbohydrate ABC transporter permease [Pseudoflavonifractor phocaeensis]OUO36110.1 sugar ABC transporter permease [Flavonifractor sp. An306]